MSCNSLLDSSNADLARFYLMGEASGTTATDLSSAGDDGTYARDATNTTTTGPGKGFEVGQDFNGSSDLMTFGSAAAFTGAYTVAYWANRVFDSTFDFVLGHSTENTKFGFRNNVQDDVFLRLRPSGASENIATGITTTAYHHYVAGRDAAGDGFLYVDGGAVAVSLSGQTGTVNLDQIGRDDLGTNYHQGDIAAVALFDAELSATEVAQLAAGPEPIWLGTGTHHFNVARDIAYWNCPSSAWGLPSYLNAASTDNGALTAEVRIVRDRGKATEEVIATSTGFSGSVAYSGTETNLTLELRVSNDGGYDDSLGDDADGWVSVAWYGLEAKLVGQWNLDEQSGTVARNQVRTLRVANPTLTGTGGTSEYGTAPDSWTEQGGGAGEGAATITSEATGTSWIASVLAGSGTAQTSLLQESVVTIGELHVFKVRWRLLSEVVGTPTLRAWTGGATQQLAALGSFTVADGWQVSTLLMPAATIDDAWVSVLSDTTGEYVHIEIDSIEVYDENAGTYDRDASNTHFSVSGLGSIRDAQLLNGTSDRVTTPAAVSFGASFTVAGWFRVDGFSAEGPGFSTCFFGGGVNVYRPLMIDTNQNTLGLAAGGFTNGTNAARSVNSAAALDGEWHHLAMAWEFTGGTAGVARFYVDGLLVDTASLTTINPASFVLWLGDGNSAGQELNGAAASCYLFSRDLESYEIAQLYAEGPTALVDVGRVAHYLLEETSGTTCRSQITEQLVDIDLSIDKSAPLGIPQGMSAYNSSLEGDEVFSSSVSGGVWTFSLSAGTAGSDYFGASEATAPSSGQGQLLEIEYNVTSVTGTAHLALNNGSTWANIASAVTGGYVTALVPFTSAGAFRLAINAVDISAAMTVNVRSLKIHAEAAGTATSDLSTLTTGGRVGRAVNLDGTDYISAPWSGGFTYPTSLACAFKLDTLTGATIRTLLSLTDASASDVYWQLGLTASGANVYVARRNTTVDAQSPVTSLTTNWHTLAMIYHDETSYSAYFDGTLLTTRTGLASVSASANVDTLLIGLLRLTSPTQYADGITFDEVSAWNRELSAYDVMNWTREVLSQRPSVFNMGLALGL